MPCRGALSRRDVPPTTRRSRARVASNAATRAHIVVHASERIRPTTNVSAPMRSSEARGTPAAAAAPTRKSLAHSAIANPATAASTPTRRFSATICRTILERVAPIASRVANSWWRSSAPPMSNADAFPQATSSRATTAAARAYRDGRTSRVSCASMSAAVAPVPLLVSGYSIASALATTMSSARAWSTVTSGRRRPITRSIRASRRPTLGSSPSGTQTSGVRGHIAGE